MEYKIVVESHSEWLEKSVQELIKKGWQPLGGVSVCVIADVSRRVAWAQAMTSTQQTREAATLARDYLTARPNV